MGDFRDTRLGRHPDSSQEWMEADAANQVTTQGGMAAIRCTNSTSTVKYQLSVLANPQQEDVEVHHHPLLPAQLEYRGGMMWDL